MTATAHDVALYFLAIQDDEEAISNLKLQKLLYYAQGFNLALTGEPLSAERAEVWGLIWKCVDDAALGRSAEAKRKAAELEARPDLNEQLAMILLPGLKAARRANLITSLFMAIDKRDGLSAAALHVLGLAQEGRPDVGHIRFFRISEAFQN